MCSSADSCPFLVTRCTHGNCLTSRFGFNGFSVVYTPRQDPDHIRPARAISSSLLPWKMPANVGCLVPPVAKPDRRHSLNFEAAEFDDLIRVDQVTQPTGHLGDGVSGWQSGRVVRGRGAWN